MIENIEELNNLFKKIQENRKIYTFPKDITLDELKDICDSSSQMTSVVEISKFSLSVVYSNQKVYDFFSDAENKLLKVGGFKFFLKVIHPENISSIFLLIKFFNDPQNRGKIFSNTYFAKSKDGWGWVYNSMKPVTFNADGSTKYMLSASCSLAESLSTKKQFKHVKKNLDFYEENVEMYLTMTNREKEVLGLTAEELSTEEIAAALLITPAAVSIIHDRLINLFGVKSADGLMKYAMLYKMV